jgi:CRP-like cAMP-binding protein
MGGGRTLSFSAAEPSTVLHLPLGAISELRANDVGFERALGSLAEFNIRVPITAVADLLIAKSDRRVAAVLLRVTDVLNRALPTDPCGFVLTQNQLAEMSNVSRSTVNLVIGNFEAKGWVQVSYSRIAIKAPGRLSKFVETGQ